MKENPLTMEMLLDQLTGLNIIQIAAITLILLVISEWILTIVQKKKGYYNSLDTHIRHIYRTCKCWYLRFIKNRNFWSHILFLQYRSMEHPKRLVGLYSLYYCYRFF
jgi:hypothetical protein